MFVDFRTDTPIFNAIRVVGGAFDQRDVFAINGAIAAARAGKTDKPIFDVARQLDDDGDGLSQAEVDILNAGLAAARSGAIGMAPTAKGREIGSAGLKLIESFEGNKLTAYLCPAKVWTIGVGHTGPDVKPGMTITPAQSLMLLQADLDRFEEAVAKAAPNATQNQFDAMVSLAFNIGVGAFLGSSVLREHKAGRHVAASDAFTMWVKGGGKVLPGLVRRRAAEAALYRGQA